MRKSTKLLKKFVALFLIVLMSIESFASVVSDNDGKAFVTKKEFEDLKESFNEQINRYNLSIDNKIDGAIADYLNGLRIAKNGEVELPYGKHKFWFTNAKLPIEYLCPDLDLESNVRMYAAALAASKRMQINAFSGSLNLEYNGHRKQHLLLCDEVVDLSAPEGISLISNGITNNLVLKMSTREYKDYDIPKYNGLFAWYNGAIGYYDPIYISSIGKVKKDSIVWSPGIWAKVSDGSNDLKRGYQRDLQYSAQMLNTENISNEYDFRWVTHFCSSNIQYEPFCISWSDWVSCPSDATLTERYLYNTDPQIRPTSKIDWVYWNTDQTSYKQEHEESATVMDTSLLLTHASARPDDLIGMPFNKGAFVNIHDMKMFDKSKFINRDNKKYYLPDMPADGGMYLGTFNAGEKISYTFSIGGWTESTGSQCEEYLIYLSAQPFEYDQTQNSGSFLNETNNTNYWETLNCRLNIELAIKDDNTKIFAQIVPKNYSNFGDYRFYVDTEKNDAVTIGGGL